MWAVLDRTSRGWHGVVMTPAGVWLLQDLRRQVHHPPRLEEVVDQTVTVDADRHGQRRCSRESARTFRHRARIGACTTSIPCSSPLEPGLPLLDIRTTHAERATLPRCCGMLCSALHIAGEGAQDVALADLIITAVPSTWSPVPCDSLCGRQHCPQDQKTVVAGFDRPRHARPKCRRV